MNKEELQKRYGQSQAGNFSVQDTIGVPHPYCITPKHVAVASDRYCGMLGEAAIKDAEKNHHAHCGMRGCKLTYAEHEQALLVGCRAELKDGDKVNPELHEYLLSIKAKCEEDKYAGFAFVRA